MTALDYRTRADVVHRDAARSWYAIDDRGKGATAQVRIYDEIGFFGTSAAQFAEDIAALDVKRIDLHLNSPGGEVWDGMAILNSLRQHPAHITTIIDGVAASIASVIAMAGDEVVMARNSELMIHDAWGLAVGNAADMADLMARLDQISNNMATVYAEKAGGTPEEWREAMRAETWYSAAEAVEVGLADRVIEKDGADEAKARHNLAIFNYAGRSAAPGPKNHPVASAPGKSEQQEAHMTDTATVDTPSAPPTGTGADATVVHTQPDPAPTAPVVTTTEPATPAAPPSSGAPADAAPNQEGAGMQIDPAGLREVFGLHPDASDDEVRAAVVASGYASVTPFGEGGASPANVGKAGQRASAPTPGVVMVDQSILDQLRQDAAAGQEAFARLVRQERDATIAAAINEGKFQPARREHWEKAWDRDPEGAKAAIKDLTKGLIPTSPAGYSVDPEGKTAEDELYADLYGKDGGN